MPVQRGPNKASRMVAGRLRTRGENISGNAISFAQNEATKKGAAERRLEVLTGRRQTEWTGATQCPEDGRHQ